MTLAFISHPDCALHDMGSGHPESPLRLAAIQKQVRLSGLEPLLEYVEAPLASREQLALAHTVEHIDFVFRSSPTQGMVDLDPDTTMNPHTLAAARRAAGAAILAVDRVMSGLNHAAFCSVRPPGHHAERHRAMGFCIFNNVAIGAAYALQKYSLQRVAIVDFDVHHGNGTENIFRHNPAVLLCSTFQSPLYPYSGTGPVAAKIINVPLPAGTDGTAFRKAVTTTFLPALDAFAPELILFSAGFDGHRDDPLASLNLLEQDYHWITTEVRNLAQRHANGRIISLLEGGYALPALASSVVAHLQALV
jgi:acetoin utilization deacetylase AcuC-like enzyme